MKSSCYDGQWASAIGTYFWITKDFKSGISYFFASAYISYCQLVYCPRSTCVDFRRYNCWSNPAKHSHHGNVILFESDDALYRFLNQVSTHEVLTIGEREMLPWISLPQACLQTLTIERTGLSDKVLKIKPWDPLLHPRVRGVSCAVSAGDPSLSAIVLFHCV